MSEASGLSKKDLLDILEVVGKQNKEAIVEAVATAIAEGKKPAPLTTQQESEIEQMQQTRAGTAEEVKAEMEGKKFIHRTCSHKHKSGETHCVFVNTQGDRTGGFILCQKNQCKIRPGVEPKDYKGGDIYDNDLFNRLFQEIGLSDM